MCKPLQVSKCDYPKSEKEEIAFEDNIWLQRTSVTEPLDSWHLNPNRMACSVWTCVCFSVCHAALQKRDQSIETALQLDICERRQLKQDLYCQ